MTTPTYTELWAACCQFIKDNIEAAQYETWFRDVVAQSYDAATRKLVLQVKSSFFADMLNERYARIMRSAVSKYFGQGVNIYYAYPVVGNDPSTVNLQKSVSSSPAIMEQVNVQAANPFKANNDADFKTQLNASYTFENYVAGDSNKIARTIGETIANDPSIKTFNPLFVYGAPGVGKTHLIQAIGIRIKERYPNKRVYYVTARLFQSQFTAATKTINQFFHFYQSIDTLIIDDIQDLQNLPGTQNTFFHIFNHLRQHDKQIIMSSDRSPAEMEGFEERMLSRFRGGMQVELDRPDIALRRQVLRQKAEQDGIELPDDVAEFIASNVSASVRELEGIMVSIMAHATVLNREITLDLARRVIENSIKLTRRQVNFEMIAEAVATYYKIKPDAIFTKSRKREISDARQVVMYLAKKLANMPLTAIGHKIDRSHATVIYACQAVENRIATESAFASEIDSIEAGLQ